MKCEKCGANLAIDNAFCPYCGTPNKIAKKHREDMADFTADYNKTKAEVIGNSKKFNKKTFRITAVAVTLLAIVLVVAYAISADEIRWRRMESHSVINEDIHVEKLKSFMTERDYLGFREYVQNGGLDYFRYGSKLYEYTTADSIADEYCEVLKAIIGLCAGEDYAKENAAKSISNHVRNMYETVDNIRISYVAEGTDEFAKAAVEDMEDMLQVYLYLSDEEIQGFRTLTEAKRYTLIEEAIEKNYEKE